ncbi:ferredoxin [Xanthobacter oligotrophicus]|uniref:ferredoxin n=1 Tax=Xanthobacter oligotrophicus TaxID=2607286 RepID=UPI0011F1CE47|nr:ferredoxin [Xanthobacter oligotrophicus]MCG5235203.1 ferredoxin [Xanthobacter oligotrophicus]
MSTVTLKVMPAGKTIEVSEGTNLLEALITVEPGLAARQTSDKDGSASHVFVQEGRKGLSKTSREENELLDAIVGVGSKSRLAKYITVLGTENVTVELLGEFSGL